MASRVSALLPLAGASAAALALAGVAVFSVNQAGCADPGRYVRHGDGQVELVGSCVDSEKLPAAPDHEPGVSDRQPAEPASNAVDPALRAP